MPSSSSNWPSTVSDLKTFWSGWYVFQMPKKSSTYNWKVVKYRPPETEQAEGSANKLRCCHRWPFIPSGLNDQITVTYESLPVGRQFLWLCDTCNRNCKVLLHWKSQISANLNHGSWLWSPSLRQTRCKSSMMCVKICYKIVQANDLSSVIKSNCTVCKMRMCWRLRAVSEPIDSRCHDDIPRLGITSQATTASYWVVIPQIFLVHM